MNLKLLLSILVLSSSIVPALSLPMDGEEPLTKPLLPRDATKRIEADRISTANFAEAQQQKEQRSDTLSVKGEETPSTSSDSSPGTESGTTISSVTTPSSINELEEQITQAKEMLLTAAGLHGIDLKNLNKLQRQAPQRSEESEVLTRSQEAYQQVADLYQEALLENSNATEEHREASELYYQNAATSSAWQFYDQMTAAWQAHQQADKKLFLTYELLQIKEQELQQLQARFSSLIEANSNSSLEVTAITAAQKEANNSKLHLDVCNKNLRLLYHKREKMLLGNGLQPLPVPLNRQSFAFPAMVLSPRTPPIVPVTSIIKEITEESCSPFEATETDSLSTLTTASLENAAVEQHLKEAALPFVTADESEAAINQWYITDDDAEHLLAEACIAAERESELIDAEKGTTDRKLTAQELQRQQQLDALETEVAALRQNEATLSFHVPSTAASESQDDIYPGTLLKALHKESVASFAVNANMTAAALSKRKKKKKKPSSLADESKNDELISSIAASLTATTPVSDLQHDTTSNNTTENPIPPKSTCEKVTDWMTQQYESFKDGFQYTRDFLSIQTEATRRTQAYYEAEGRIPAEVPIQEYTSQNDKIATLLHLEKIEQRKQNKASQEIQKQREPQHLTTESEVAIEPEVSPFASENTIAWAFRLFWKRREALAKIKEEAKDFDQLMLKSLQWLLPSKHTLLQTIIYHPERATTQFEKIISCNHQLMSQLNKFTEQKKRLISQTSQQVQPEAEVAMRREEIALRVAEARAQQQAEIEAKAKENEAAKAAQELIEQENREQQSGQQLGLRNRKKTK